MAEEGKRHPEPALSGVSFLDYRIIEEREKTITFCKEKRTTDGGIATLCYHKAASGSSYSPFSRQIQLFDSDKTLLSNNCYVADKTKTKLSLPHEERSRKGFFSNISEAEGLSALKKCLAEAKRRFVANLPNFQVMVIDKNGFRQLDNVKV